MRNEELIETTGTQLIDRVADWLMSHALGDSDVEQIFDGCCHRLHAAGIPLWRGLITFRTLHPLFASTSLIWRRGDGADMQHSLHGEAFTSDEWFKSPMYHLLKTQVPFLRRRLVGDGALLDFPALSEFRDQGATDYFAYLIPFARDDEPGPHTDGIIGSWATDRDSGFTDNDIQSLMRIQRRLVVSCKVQIKNQVTKDVLDTYLGPDAGRQVLNGQIKRGDGETIHAVIWFSDMRDSTRLADVLSGEGDRQWRRGAALHRRCRAGHFSHSGRRQRRPRGLREGA
jgi:adenylate cyclase